MRFKSSYQLLLPPTFHWPIVISSVEEEGEVATKNVTKVKPPRKYKVLMHNDDYTTMDFVIYVLQRFFQKDFQQAQAIMLKVHHEGVGVCGIFTFEVAESKATKVTRYAREKGHPLKCSCEPCDP